MKIDRMNRGDWGKIKAFFDLITTDGFTIKGFKLIEVKKEKVKMMNIMTLFGLIRM